uniref:AAA ATPase domain-containing protein n=1 Tax=Candidatus Kentrum sp. MB TaxID=2138164 RepID=A0A450XET5_9GAMM|nr:MAG: hypothetical protein BECKMB1821G_GA0114241_103031 [Candidatus Kentron sp. MB]
MGWCNFAIDMFKFIAITVAIVWIPTLVYGVAVYGVVEATKTVDWMIPNLLIAILIVLALSITSVVGIFLVYRFIDVQFSHWRNKKSKRDDKGYSPEPGSEFKDLVIPLPDFRFHHEPRRGENDYRDFIGRDALAQSFLDLLRHGQDRSGSYLVTGYRGVGKTSFVRKVLNEYAVGRRGPIPERRTLFTSNPWVRNIYWWYLRERGELTLCWHRRLFSKQFQECDERRRPHSLFFRALLDRWLPQRGMRWYTLINLVGVLWLVFAPVRLIFDFVVVLILIANNLQHNHGYLFSQILHLLRVPWRPLIRVYINLGYELKDPKHLLFNLIALLHSQYKRVASYGSPAGLVRLILITVMSFALAEEIYLRINNTGAEHFFQRELLGIPYLSDGLPEELLGGISKGEGLDGKEWNKVLSNDLVQHCNTRFHVTNDPTRRMCDAPRAVCGDPGSVGIREAFLEFYCQMNKLGEQTSQLFVNPPKVDRLDYICMDDRIMRTIKTTALLVTPFYRGEEKEVGVLASYNRYPKNLKTHCVWSGNGVEIDDASEEDDKSDKVIRITPFQFFYYILVLFLSFLVFRALTARFMGSIRVFRQLDALYQRTIATESVDVGIGQGGIFQTRRKRAYHSLDEREAENGLIGVIEKNRDIPLFFFRPDIVFVFDELDKVEPKKDGVSDKANPLGISDAIRARKFELESLLGNLKNLITIAPCRFIFIAGREMMDANLADRGETRYLYGSLFDQVIYVPSFLTDDSDGNEADISSMVEQYVCRRLMRPGLAKYLYWRQLKEENEDTLTIAYKLGAGYHHWSLRTYYRYQRELHKDGDKDKNNGECNRIERMEIVRFLQDFVYFLAYRSAGNPKKLALLFEEFVRPLNDDFFVGTDEARHQVNPYHRHSPPIEFGTGRLLRMDYQDQYRIQLISHFFIVLHGEQSRLIERYGDKLSVSVFGILDYISKFHSNAFSSMELERMPNILDIYRLPALPGIIDGLLTRLLRPYLRRMGNGLFHYRFLEYFRYELLYASQFSEEDMAAFNFSLDNSIQIKQHYRQLLEEQRQGHGLSHDAASLSSESVPLIPHAFPYLHDVLGDLHFLDKEYDQAYIEYRNAIQYLKPFIQSLDTQSGLATREIIKIKRNGTEKITSPLISEEIPDTPLQEDITQLLLYIRFLLKLGLLEEHRGLHKRATLIYHQACRVVDHVMKGKHGTSFIGLHFEQVNGLVQPHLCLAFMHAKRDAIHHTADKLMEQRTNRLTGFIHGAIDKNGKMTPLDLHSRLARNVDRLVKENNAESEKENRRKLGLEPNGEEEPFEHRMFALMQIPDRLRMVAESYIRWAELLFWRSDFRGATQRYISAIRLLRKSLNLYGSDEGPCAVCDVSDDPKAYRILEILGMALMGLGDAATALHLHKYYRNSPMTPKDNETQQSTATNAIRLPGDGDDPYTFDMKKPESHETTCERLYEGVNLLLGDTTWEMNEEPILRNGIDKTARDALRYYVLAAYAFRLSDNSSDGRLALWKLSYALGMGLGYAKEKSLSGSMHSPFKNDNAMCWLFGKSGRSVSDAPNLPIQVMDSHAFRWSYRAHHQRLGNLFFEGGIPKISDISKTVEISDPYLSWITPPFSQSATLLGMFWHAYWQNASLDQTAFKIQHMGAFPVNVRILAYYLKARWYLKSVEEIEKDCQLDPSDQVTQKKEINRRKAYALRFLVQCIEEGSAYEGGVDLLIPPLGLVYYHLWEIVNEKKGKGEKDINNKKSFIDTLQRESGFNGEQRRYLDEEYCRTSARRLLHRMISRHNGGSAYFEWVRQRYYLQDGFADDYTNVAWAMDYALIPVAERMLAKLSKREEREEGGANLHLTDHRTKKMALSG